jgi:translation initiation factor 2 alpha subunit (eIF-2alpha)
MAGDLVYTQVIRIEPAYSLVALLEYNNIQGMIVHTQLSGKKIYGNLSKYIHINQKLVLEVLKVDGDNIDLTNRHTSDKQTFMIKYKQAHALHMTSQYVASKLNWSFDQFLETIIYPLYNNQTAYQNLSDSDFRHKWIQEHLSDPELCLIQLNKLFSPKLIKPDPILLSLECYTSDAIQRLRKFGLDTELSCENVGICIRFERIGERYAITMDQKEMDPKEYKKARNLILEVLERLILGTEITMNIF